MKRMIRASASDKGFDVSTIDTIPDIDNRYLDADVVISWLDKLVEVHENEKAASNK